ncbi:MAG: YheU family protein [Bdellovibrionaceae bacterium]|nr:YheU family protein [Bdellovibrio sp.]
MLVPLEKISDEALHGLIEEFILREGTDYGQVEISLEKKHEQIRKQLVAEHIFVVFDPTEQTASIVRKENLPKDS